MIMYLRLTFLKWSLKRVKNLYLRQPRKPWRKSRRRWKSRSRKPSQLELFQEQNTVLKGELVDLNYPP